MDVKTAEMDVTTEEKEVKTEEKKVKNTEMVSISIQAGLSAKIDDICAKMGRSRDWFWNKAARKFMRECLEDIADYEAGMAAWEEFEKGDRKTYTLDEVRKELGL